MRSWTILGYGPVPAKEAGAKTSIHAVRTTTHECPTTVGHTQGIVSANSILQLPTSLPRNLVTWHPSRSMHKRDGRQATGG
ncbi:hypothetical protein OKW33_006448 [Paraburkholderia atlantica]|nr:hypothetical protein [Paraburkholderia atlantica]